MAKVKNTTIINAKRIQEIVNYDVSLGMLVNPNIKQQLVDIKEIDCNRVFGGNTELSEIEVFIRSINSYLNYRNDYNKVLQTKELDKDFPREQRQKIANDLEEEIKKEYRKITTVGKINKTLRRASESRVEALGVELRDILSTLEVPTEDYINNMLYIIAESKIKEIKNRLDSKIAYLSSVMEEIE